MLLVENGGVMEYLQELENLLKVTRFNTNLDIIIRILLILFLILANIYLVKKILNK